MACRRSRKAHPLRPFPIWAGSNSTVCSRGKRRRPGELWPRSQRHCTAGASLCQFSSHDIHSSPEDWVDNRKTHPALLAKNSEAPTTSEGAPMRPTGEVLRICSPKESRVAFIILVSKGPQARTLLVMWRSPRSVARWRDRWCRPALLAE